MVRNDGLQLCKVMVKRTAMVKAMEINKKIAGNGDLNKQFIMNVHCLALHLALGVHSVTRRQNI